MAEARLVVVSPGERHTHPKDPNVYESARRYNFPKIGQTFLYFSEATQDPKITENGKPYGLMVIEDWIYQVIAQNQPSDGPTVMETKIEKGAVIASDLARRYGKLGVLVIKGQEPTASEIEQAKRNRRAFGMHMIQRDEHEIKRKRRPEHSLAAMSWAEEHNVRLSDLTEIKSVEQTPVDNRLPCPECAELVQPQAKICIHCRTQYGKPLAELLEEQDAEANEPPEIEGEEAPRRGPGRPRKVPVLV